jgi:hypothetical protein
MSIDEEKHRRDRERKMEKKWKDRLSLYNGMDEEKVKKKKEKKEKMFTDSKG